MKNRIYLVLLLSTTIFYALPAFADVLQEDFEYHNTMLSGFGNSSGYLGQTWTPASSYSVSSAAFDYEICGGGSITVSIRATDSYGFPTGSDLGSAIAACSVGWVVVSFSSPISVTSGNSYALIVHDNGGENDPYADSSAAYANGKQVRSADGGSTWGTYDYDMPFKIWSSDVISSVTPSSNFSVATSGAPMLTESTCSTISDGNSTTTSCISTTSPPLTTDDQTFLAMIGTFWVTFFGFSKAFKI